LAQKSNPSHKNFRTASSSQNFYRGTLLTGSAAHPGLLAERSSEDWLPIRLQSADTNTADLHHPRATGHLTGKIVSTARIVTILSRRIYRSTGLINHDQQ